MLILMSLQLIKIFNYNRFKRYAADQINLPAKELYSAEDFRSGGQCEG